LRVSGARVRGIAKFPVSVPGYLASVRKTCWQVQDIFHGQVLRTTAADIHFVSTGQTRATGPSGMVCGSAQSALHVLQDENEPSAATSGSEEVGLVLPARDNWMNEDITA